MSEYKTDHAAHGIRSVMMSPFADRSGEHKPTDNKPHNGTAHSGPLQFRIGIRILQLTDLLASFVAVSVTLHNASPALLSMTLGEAFPILLFPIALSLGISLLGGYRKTYSTDILSPFLAASMGAAFGAALFSGVMGASAQSLTRYQPAMMISWGLVTCTHLCFALATKRSFQTQRFFRKLLLVGATPRAERLIEQSYCATDYTILGVFDDRSNRRPQTQTGTQTERGLPILGKIDDLLNWKHLPQVDQIIITVTSSATDRIKTIISRLRILPQQVILLIDLDSFQPAPSATRPAPPMQAVYVSGQPINVRQRLIKRATDLVLSSLLLILFAPIMLLCAALIKLEDGGPVLFRQQRHGFHNELIGVWKLRTMIPDKAAQDRIVSQTRIGDARVTRIGKFLRQTSLDELPQLFNVLAGNMSLVGPRPHAVGMTAEATELQDIVLEYAHRHRVKPGITGWAQINGSRGPVHTQEAVRERVRLDIAYLNTASFLLDIYIMLRTVPALLGDRRRHR